MPTFDSNLCAQLVSDSEYSMESPYSLIRHPGSFDESEKGRKKGLLGRSPWKGGRVLRERKKGGGGCPEPPSSKPKGGGVGGTPPPGAFAAGP